MTKQIFKNQIETSRSEKYNGKNYKCMDLISVYTYLKR